MTRISKRVSPPAITPEARENQLISLAYNEVERRIRDGSATSQELTVFLKAGSQRNRIEIEKLKHENEMLRAKTEAIESAKKEEELYAEVIDALRKYSGDEDDGDVND